MSHQEKLENRRKISQQRARELKDYTLPYHQITHTITRGSDDAMVAQQKAQKQKLLTLLNATEENWNDWTWQVKNRISDATLLAEVLGLPNETRATIEEVGKLYRWAITPYYLSLINPNDPADPVYALSIPNGLELDPAGEEDPMNEEFTNPVGIITRRYPDRLILNVTNACAMYCRHCQRRRRIGDADAGVTDAELQESLDYIRNSPEIRDVLVTGGDALLLSNDKLEYILKTLRTMPHVEMIRLGTRTPVTMPMRVDDALLTMIRKYHPVFINTHFNHPRELTPEAIKACEKLVDAGIPLANQMVLLAGVNNDKYVVQTLNHELMKARVIPYYIFHAKPVKGTTHLCTSFDDGLEIMEYLRGNTSGMAIPTYVINAPGGLGKIPLLPDYIVQKTDETITLRTWEGQTMDYPNNPKGHQ